MNLYEKIANRQTKISVIGLGYVGLPIAVSFAKKTGVIGFDVNRKKIEQYKSGMDPTQEVGNEAMAVCTVEFTSDEARLREAKFHIIAVPTPVNADHTPDLSPIESASHTVGRNLTKGSVVVYESTVYPGVTEDICVPILENESGLTCGIDFKVGYSPERINPGDKDHRLESIIKIVSGMDEETLETVGKVYELVVEAGVYKAENIRIAEAAKVIENSQRDINIAFMNELSIIFDKMGIDTQSVLKAAATKWNFLKFTPGLVGGHCIGVDPYYLMYKAEGMGYHSQVILSGRKINDDMGKYVAENTIKQMIKGDKQIKGATVAVLGLTFKEDCPDVRNTKVMDIVNELREYGIKVRINDPVADKQEVLDRYGIEMCELEDIHNVDAVILAVSHTAYRTLPWATIKGFYNHNHLEINGYAKAPDANDSAYKNVLIDVKGTLDRKAAESGGFLYWRL